MPRVPTPSELAQAAVAALLDPGQALAVWERRLAPAGATETTRVTVTAVADGRTASAEAAEPTVAGGERAARAASLHARRMRALPAPALPSLGTGVASFGAPALDVIDPAVLDAAVRASVGPGVSVSWSAGSASVAVVSTTGVDVAETRSWVTVTVRGAAADGRSAEVTRVGNGSGAAASAGGHGEVPSNGNGSGEGGVGSDAAASCAGGPAEAPRGGDGPGEGGVGSGGAAICAGGPGEAPRGGNGPGEGGGRADAAASSADDALVVDAVGLLAAEAASEVRALLGAAQRTGPLVVGVPAVRKDPPPRGPVAVVLGPEAVAVVLDALRSSLGVGLALADGPFAVPFGTVVAGPRVSLGDDARHPLTLPRAFDAEGVRRQRVELIRGGAAVGGVRDCAAAERAAGRSTGHATRPLTLAPSPEHLVLAPGHAADVAALCRALGAGLYLPTLTTAYEPGDDGERIRAAPGAALVRDGAPAGGLVDLHVAVDAAAVLRGIEQLTVAARAVPLRGHCPGGIGAAVVPALLTTAGVGVWNVDAG